MHLQKRDVIVLMLCGSLLVCTLGAAGRGGRGRAREFVCQANLHQWHGIFQDYIDHNGGTFVDGEGPRGYWWIKDLDEEHRDWKRAQNWFCPEATVPVTDETGATTATLPVFHAWGIFYGTGFGPNGISGSYGLNGWILNIPDTGKYNGTLPAVYGWRDLYRVPNPSAVPMFIDALRFDLLPLYADSPAPNEQAPWSTANHMARCCINRHEGAVNCLFLDGSVRKVGLKELWTLKWHRMFDTAGPWAKAGGVTPADWPQWMRSFKEY